MGELLQRMGSTEIQEWIVELGELRPEEERAAMDAAEQKNSTQKTLKPLTRADIADHEERN